MEIALGFDKWRERQILNVLMRPAESAVASRFKDSFYVNYPNYSYTIAWTCDGERMNIQG